MVKCAKCNDIGYYRTKLSGKYGFTEIDGKQVPISNYKVVICDCEQGIKYRMEKINGYN